MRPEGPARHEPWASESDIFCPSAGAILVLHDERTGNQAISVTPSGDFFTFRGAQGALEGEADHFMARTRGHSKGFPFLAVTVLIAIFAPGWGVNVLLLLGFLIFTYKLMTKGTT